jgi:hypothetical protein
MGIERMGMVRRPAELRNRQAKENVVHGSITDQADFEDIVPIDSGFSAKLGDQSVYTIDYGLAQLCKFFAGPGVCDSADYVVAETRLRIKGSFCCTPLAGCHVDKSGDNRSCSQIDSKAVYRDGRTFR